MSRLRAESSAMWLCTCKRACCIAASTMQHQRMDVILVCLGVGNMVCRERVETLNHRYKGIWIAKWSVLCYFEAVTVSC